MNSARPSILLRPRRQSSHCNDETADIQYSKEQALLELKRQKHEAAENSMRRYHEDAPKDERTAAALELRAFQAHQLESKATREELRRRDDARAIALRNEMDEQAAWSEETRKRERALANRAAMQDNLRAMEDKRSRAAEEKRKAIELDNANLAATMRR
jgi:hypothetical protein